MEARKHRARRSGEAVQHFYHDEADHFQTDVFPESNSGPFCESSASTGPNLNDSLPPNAGMELKESAGRLQDREPLEESSGVRFLDSDMPGYSGRSEASGDSISSRNISSGASSTRSHKEIRRHQEIKMIHF